MHSSGTEWLETDLCDRTIGLTADTDRFRDGAEPNDDLTMLAFRFTACTT
jgi:hypothetical protein